MKCSILQKFCTHKFSVCIIMEGCLAWFFKSCLHFAHSEPQNKYCVTCSIFTIKGIEILELPKSHNLYIFSTLAIGISLRINTRQRDLNICYSIQRPRCKNTNRLIINNFDQAISNTIGQPIITCDIKLYSLQKLTFFLNIPHKYIQI